MKIVFISYPKSGRTWMRYVFSLLGTPIAFSHAGHGTSSLDEIGEPFSELKLSQLGDKNIFMFRNPLDTAVSLYFQVHKKDFQSGPTTHFRKFLKLLIRRRLPPKDINRFVIHPVWGVENICRFNRAWLDFLSNRNDALSISYEDARNDPEAVIEQLGRFAGTASFNAKDIAEKSSFESMKQLELQGKSRELRLYGLRNSDQETMKVRRGVVGGYKDYLDPETIDEAKKIAARFQFEI